MVAEFSSPEPRTVVMRIIDGEDPGSVVETHATPVEHQTGRAPRTAVIEAVIAHSDRPGFVHALRGGPMIKPFMRSAATRLWRDDLAYAERLFDDATAANPQSESRKVVGDAHRQWHSGHPARADGGSRPRCDSGSLEQWNLLGRPRNDRPRQLGGQPQLRPRQPPPFHHLIPSGLYAPICAGAEDRADLVFHRCVSGGRTVSKLRQHTDWLVDSHAEFVDSAATHRLFYTFAWPRVAGRTSWSTLRPGAFDQGAPG